MIGDKPLTNTEKCNRWRDKDPERYKTVRVAQRKRDAAKIAEYNAAYYRKHKARIGPKALKRASAWYEQADNKTRVKARTLRERYRLTLGEFAAMRAAQNDQCAICAFAFTKTPCVDHDHDTGAIRGLLCHRCNKGIGLLRDNPDIVASALRYLGAYGKPSAIEMLEAMTENDTILTMN